MSACLVAIQRGLLFRFRIARRKCWMIFQWVYCASWWIVKSLCLRLVLSQVFEFVQLPELFYAGSHGMDRMGPADGCNGFKLLELKLKIQRFVKIGSPLVLCYLYLWGSFFNLWRQKSCVVLCLSFFIVRMEISLFLWKILLACQNSM